MNFFKAIWLRILNMFGAARSQTSAKVSPATPVDNAVRRPNSTYEKLQSMPSPKEPNPVAQMNQDIPYQASKSGAAATSAASRPPRKASNTFNKLQSLSASGTGVNAPTPTTEDTPLSNLLERLDLDEPQS
jgi:hypothetical protein